MTRTARVDGVISGNNHLGLKAEASLVGSLHVKIPDVLSIPENAVVRTGDHTIVYLSDGKGGFAPRIVKLGVKADGRFEVKSGLVDGEKISSGPNFLFDSESRIEFSDD
jgi:Cu(I)/Ag(I) efflux system membrane fusion protein